MRMLNYLLEQIKKEKEEKSEKLRKIVHKCRSTPATPATDKHFYYTMGWRDALDWIENVIKKELERAT